MWKLIRFLAVITLLLVISCIPLQEKITYLSVERCAVPYFNTKYLANVTNTARRHNRRDVQYYYNLNLTSKVWGNNNYKVDIYFYELLTNRYKPSFVELHDRLCVMLNKDKIFGAPVLRALNHSCPLPPGTYHLWNLTVPIEAVPRGFPFTKGRIYMNMSFAPTEEYVAGGQCDIELKQMRRYRNPA